MSSALSSELRTRFREDGGEGWRGTGAVTLDVQGRPPGHGRHAAQQGLPENPDAQDGNITLPEPAGVPAPAPAVSPMSHHRAVPAQAQVGAGTAGQMFAALAEVFDLCEPQQCRTCFGSQARTRVKRAKL